MSNMKQPMNSSSPHFWWIVGTMGVIIIALTAFILTKRVIGVKVIVDYISFASLLLSIILSIFAILFTHSSNSLIKSIVLRIAQLEHLKRLVMQVMIFRQVCSLSLMI